MAFPLKKYYANTPCTFVGTGDIVYIPDDVEVTELEPTTGAIMMALNDKGSLLPPGYTRIAYLEATGSQLIDTGIFFTQDVNYEIDYQNTSQSTNVIAYFISNYAEAGKYVLLGIYSAASHGWCVTHTLSAGFALPENISYDSRIKFRHDGTNLYANEEPCLFTGSTTLNLENKSKSLVFFARNHKDDGYTSFSKCRIFNAKIKYDSKVVYDFIFAIDVTGTPCMYDLITETPYYGSGSGKFVAGIETRNQLYALLANLPDLTGQADPGELTIRLDASLQTDELRAMIDERGEAKNWEITEAPELEL